ncbi:hypothetical protein ZWY2020_046123 [Hordeum vulgare]|nr:hypothetical protein ZWY2020_046123 [Hordeum vulgare]
MAAACSWVLVDSKAYIDDDTNGSTAEEFTNTSNHIGVSLWPASPPIPSRLSVHVKWMHPGHEFLHEPKILCAADCVFLLRVAIGSISTRPTYKMSDYFIYQLATSTGPLLKLLPHPYPHLFRDDDVGLLPRDDDFTIAALTQPSYFKFVLYLFKSEDWYWTSREVLVDPPQTPFPEPLPPGRRHFGHVTSSVITIGSRGAIGWVDLWNGILLYDELHDDDNKLRFVPLPVRLESHGGHALECCPKPYRSVSVLGDCLKFVELEPSGDRLPGKDPETGGPTSELMTGHSPHIPTATSLGILTIGKPTSPSMHPTSESTEQCGPDCFAVECCCVRLTTVHVRLQRETCKISGHISLLSA